MNVVSGTVNVPLARAMGYSHSGSWISAIIKCNTSSTEYVLVDDMIVEKKFMRWMITCRKSSTGREFIIARSRVVSAQPSPVPYLSSKLKQLGIEPNNRGIHDRNLGVFSSYLAYLAPPS